ncbi:unnamed protein product [Mytilus edulis]|uniref:MEGF10_11 n=1 Tax=Mytilus edulis TaxID=6550 RepID=A0A8S3TCD2_MYTED|nr:unnamed protein product [Mytilus edulis]
MGEPCHICSIGYYGRKCGDICDCVANRCHHVFGCVIPEITTVQKLQSTNNGLVSFILLLCTLILRRYKRRNTNTQHFLNSTSLEQPFHAIEIPTVDEPTEIVNGIYETIDESSILDLPISMLARNIGIENDGSISDDNSDPLPNDGYINPYQPIVQEFETHGYSSIADKSDSDCSCSSKSERVSEYLNPYQTIVPDQDKHEYLKVNNDSCLETNNLNDSSNQSPLGTQTDEQNYTSSKYIEQEDTKYQCDKLESSDYEDIWDMDKNVQASMHIEENELSHDQYHLKICINEHTDSSDILEKVDHCL